MEIIKDIKRELKISGSVATIGTFDGLHIGHQKIIKLLMEKSKQLNLKSVVITFYPHPRVVLGDRNDIKLLTPIEEKVKLFENFGIDFLLVVPFSKEFAKKTYQEFLNEIVIDKVKAKFLIIGYDHKFGKNREGDITKLKEYLKEKDLDMMIVGPEKIEENAASSTKIREALKSNNLDFANKMLGHYYFIEGVVVEGAKRGRTIGYPTANLKPSENNKLVPPNGVYFVRIKYDQKQYFGVANIGLRPTFNNVKEPITEVYIFDFNKDIYGENICIEFIKKIRDEVKFNTIEELEIQIKKDVEYSKSLISKTN
ncbi:MAG: bifunctional riboflavin kinase/FAD synthetase [Ignavibacteriales bacterium]|nr:bifunctional riboflavin kinase/FAD synthetase [Ignavibacteriales bacterium]